MHWSGIQVQQVNLQSSCGTAAGIWFDLLNALGEVKKRAEVLTKQ